MPAPDLIQSIVIAGGGTAGWMSAAALANAVTRAMPGVAITLVESEEIGTIGVGEATIPPIRQFNAMLGLSEPEFMKATLATCKLGVELCGWGEIGERYLHPFGVYGLKAEMGHFLAYWLKLKAAGEALDIEDYSLCTVAARAGRMTDRSDIPASVLGNFGSAYHFDATLYARFLRDYAEARGVRRIEGQIVDVTLSDENGHIRSVRLQSGQVIEGELFIDCSGFAGVLIEKTLHTGYEDWTHWLPVNRAVAAPCNLKGELSPYTIVTAREAGWTWRIPLQHRVGNGYVFSDRFTTEETAAALLRTSLESAPLSEPRLLRFTTGRRRQAWSRNVVAIGLSSGFLEPLESTSIHMIQSGIERLLKHFPDRRFSPANTAAYNAGVSQEMERIRDFLILHYKATRRTDSAFWNHVRTMDIPDSLALRMEIFRERGQLIHAPDELFVDTSWLSVLIGQGVTPQGYDPLVESTDIAVLRQGFAQMKAHLADLTAAMPTHYDCLKRRGCLAETAGLIKGAAELAMVHRDGEAEVAAAEIGMTDISFAR